MIILAIRTDKPEAEIALYRDAVLLGQEIWYAHRELAEGLLQKIQALVQGAHMQLTDIDGIVCYEGPGSFTGLRIGLTVANTLAQSYGISMAGASGDDWAQLGMERLVEQPQQVVFPVYGADAHITLPKK